MSVTTLRTVATYRVCLYTCFWRHDERQYQHGTMLATAAQMMAWRRDPLPSRRPTIEQIEEAFGPFIDVATGEQ